MNRPMLPELANLRAEDLRREAGLPRRRSGRARHWRVAAARGDALRAGAGGAGAGRAAAARPAPSFHPDPALAPMAPRPRPARAGVRGA